MSETHRVAVVVFVDAEGVDARDAVNVAEIALAQSRVSQVIAPSGVVRSVRVVDIAEVNRALRAGGLFVTPKEIRH